MSHWNYRVCKEVIEQPTGEKEECYSIREVYYNNDKQIFGISEEPQYPYGETKEELNEDLEKIRACVEKPVIDLDNIVFVKPDWESNEEENKNNG